MNLDYFITTCYSISVACYCFTAHVVLSNQYRTYKRLGEVLDKLERNHQLKREIILLLTVQNALRKSEHIRKSTTSVSSGGDTNDVSLDGEQD